MKTAISVPDRTFIRADAVARRLGISRSELYARALDAFLGPPTDDDITAALDRIYGDESSALDPALDPAFGLAQRRAIGATW